MKQNKNSISKHMVFSSVILIMFLTIALTLSIVGVMNNAKGWFSNNKNVTGSGMGVSVKSEVYELDTHNEEVLTLDSSKNKDAMLIDYFTELGVTSNQASTSPSETSITCVMVEDTHDSREEIAPGSFGHISFDIVLKQAGDLSFELGIDLLGAKVVDDKNNLGNKVLETVDSVSITRDDINYDIDIDELLTGHILFFETREEIGETGYYHYSNPIEDKVIYNTALHEDDLTIINGESHYKVEFYWIWPHSFSQIAFKESDDRVRGKSVFSGNATGDDLRSDMIDYMASDPDKFFVWFDEPNIPSTDGVFNNGYENNHYITMVAGYNNGDQLIGENVSHLIANITTNICGES